MNECFEFLRECGTFWLTTSQDNCPASRPFGAVMKYNDMLYISTSNEKDVYRQLKLNTNIQITALKAGTREWIRISGNAIEAESLEEKEAMLIACPILKKHFSSAKCNDFAVFKIVNEKINFC